MQVNPFTALLLGALLLSSAQAQQAPAAPSVPEVPQAAAQDLLSDLTITLPERVRDVLFSLPAAALSDPTVTVNGKPVTGTPLADTTANGSAGPSTLVFRVANPGRTLNITLHGTLSGDTQVGVAVQYDTRTAETLSGTLKYTPAPVVQPGTVTTGRDGVIRTPASGTVQRGRSSTNVTTVSGFNQPFTLLVNGTAVPERLIGRQVDDQNLGTTTREYVAVPLEPGHNVLTAVTPEGEDEVTLEVAGPAANVKVTDRQLVADGFTPLTLSLDVTDADGRPTVLPSISITDPGRLTLVTPDSDTAQAGQQILTQNGTATLTFAAVSAPVTTSITLDINNHPVTIPVTVLPAHKRTVSVIASATISDLTGTPSAHGDLRATIEAPILGGQLTVNGDSHGAHTDTPAETRFPTLGDRSRETRPLEADGMLAARFDHKDFTVTYARNVAVDPVFNQGDDGDTLNLVTNGDTHVSAYFAPFAGNTVERDVPLNGTRVTRLPSPLDPSRVRLFLDTTTDGVTVTSELVPGRDFVIDEVGVITFARPLFANPDVDVALRVSARGPVTGGTLAPAGQVTLTRDFKLGEANASLSAAVHAGTEDLTYGVRYQAADTKGAQTYAVDARAAATASGSQVQVLASGKSNQLAWNASAQHESEGYDGHGATGNAGQTLTAGAQLPLNEQYGVRADVRVQNNTGGFGARLNVGGTYTPDTQSQYSLGVFGGVGTLGGLGVSGSARWKAGPWTTALTAQQQLTALTGNYSAQVTRLIPLPEKAPPGSELAFGVKMTGTLTDGAFSYRAGAVLNGRSGPYTASIEYGLPTVSDAGGELRGSVNATFPITSRLNIGAGLLVSPDAQTISADGRYTSPNTVASAGADFTHDASAGNSASVKFSVSHALRNDTTPFGITADGLSTFTQNGSGHRYSIGATYRGEDWNTAAYLRYRAGLLTSTETGHELTAELNSTVHNENGQLRFGLAAQSRASDAQSLTFQGLMSARYWVTENAALGAAYRGLYNTTLNSYAQSIGLEGTYKVLDTTAFSLGYNFGGFDSITAEPTRKGWYLRLEMLLDDTRRPSR